MGFLFSPLFKCWSDLCSNTNQTLVIRIWNIDFSNMTKIKLGEQKENRIMVFFKEGCPESIKTGAFRIAKWLPSTSAKWYTTFGKDLYN